MRRSNEDFAKADFDVAGHQAMLAFLEEELSTKYDAMKRSPVEDESVKGETTKDERTKKATGWRRQFADQDQDAFICRKAGQLFDTLTRALQSGAMDVHSNAPPLPPPPNTANGRSPLDAWRHTPSGSRTPCYMVGRSRIQPPTRVRRIYFRANQARGQREVLSGSYLACISCPILLGDPQRSARQGVARNRRPSLIPQSSPADCKAYQSDVTPNLRFRPRRHTMPVLRQRHSRKIFSPSRGYKGSRPNCEVAGSELDNPKVRSNASAFTPTLPLMPYSPPPQRYATLQHATSPRGMAVLSMTHLYKAGQRYGLIKSAWKDMDFILENHVSFKGGRPGFQPIVAKPSERADTFEMAAIFRAALGVPTVDLNTAVRPRLPAISHLAWRKITHKSDLIDAMGETHRAVDRLDCTDRESINLVLAQLSDAESKGKNNGRKTTKHTLVDFLETYERHLAASKPLLRFDYIGFLDILSSNMHTSSLRHRPGPKNAAPCSPWNLWISCRGRPPKWSKGPNIKARRNSVRLCSRRSSAARSRIWTPLSRRRAVSPATACRGAVRAPTCAHACSRLMVDRRGGLELEQTGHENRLGMLS